MLTHMDTTHILHVNKRYTGLYRYKHKQYVYPVVFLRDVRAKELCADDRYS